MTKQQAIERLAQIRAEFDTVSVSQRTYVRAVLGELWNIERSFPQSEMWHCGKLVSELSEYDRVGDHLSATRRNLGLIA